MPEVDLSALRRYWVRTVDVSAVKHHVLQHLPVSPAVPVSRGPLLPNDAVMCLLPSSARAWYSHAATLRTLSDQTDTSRLDVV